MKLLRVLALLLLPVLAQAEIHVLSSVDLPITLGATYQNDTIRFSGTSVTTANHAIIVATSGVLIDGQGDTLFYGTSGGDFSEALYLQFNGDVFRCQNLVIVHDPENDGFDLDTLASGAFENTNVWLNSPDGVRFYKCTFYVFGDNARNIDCYGGDATSTENVVLDSCRFYNYCDRYVSRHSYDGSAIRMEERGSFTGADFACSIRYCNVYIAPQMGINVFGKFEPGFADAVGVYVHNCSTWVDARNSGGGQNANQFGMHFSGITAPAVVRDNYVGAGTKYGGSRGVMIQAVSGNGTDSFQFLDNVINVWSGPDVENANGECRGLRIRSLSGASGWDYVRARGNDVTICVDTNTLTTHIGQSGWALNLTAYSNENGRGHGLIDSNVFTVRSLSNSTLIRGAACHVGIDPTYTGVLPLIIRENKFVSSDRPFWLADEFNTMGCHDMTFFQDTLGFLPGGDSGFNVSDRITYFIGDSKSGVGSIAMNAYYIDGATDTNIVLSSDESGSEDLLLAQRINVSAVGTNSQLVATAGVKIFDGNNTQVLSVNALTDGDTMFTFRYWKGYGSSGAGSDSDMNPFDIMVWSGADTTLLTDTVIDWHVTCLPVHLAATSGTLDASDTCDVAATPNIECPIVTLQAPAHLSTLQDYNVDLTALFGDTDGDTLDVAFFGDAIDPSPQTQIADSQLIADDNWVFNWGPLSEDVQYFWQARAIDASNCTTWSAIRAFTVDSIVLPQAGSNYNIVPGNAIR